MAAFKEDTSLGPLKGTPDEEWLLQSPLHVAAYTGDLSKLEALLETGMCVDSNIVYSVDCPIHTEGVDEVEGQGRTALMYSCMADQVDTLTALLKKGALLTAQDSNGQTALHWAAITVCVCVCVYKPH